MQKIPSLVSVTKKQLLSLQSITWIFTIALLYIALTLFSLNYRFILDTVNGAFPLSVKATILFELFGGLFTAFSPSDTWITIASALLVGINMVLIGKTIYTLEHTGKLKLSVGGATVLSLVATGCSSCGFSFLSLLGLGSSLSFIPLHALGLHIFSLALLIFSALYMIKKLRDGLYCKTTS